MVYGFFMGFNYMDGVLKYMLLGMGLGMKLRLRYCKLNIIRMVSRLRYDSFFMVLSSFDGFDGRLDFVFIFV